MIFSGYPQDYILQVDNELSKSDCEEIIEFFENSKDKRDGKTMTSYSNEVNKNSRICTDLYIPTDSLFFDKILKSYYNRISDYFNMFPLLRNSFPEETPYNDLFLITKYKKGIGEFKEHVDQQTTLENPRMLVSIWYLNTVEDGGETYFPLLNNLKIKPKVGKHIIFPANWIFAHSSKKAFSNDKYIISSFSYSFPVKIPEKEFLL